MFLSLCLTSLLMAATMCCLLNVRISRANPGIRVQITKKGRDYANELALNKMHSELSNYQFEEFKNKGYRLFRISISHVSKPSGQVLLVPGQGLKWSVSIHGYKLEAKFRITKKIIVKLRKTFKLSMDIKHVGIELIFNPTKTTDGGLDLKVAHCKTKADVKVSAKNVIVKLVLRFFRDKINDVIEKKVCKSAVKLINNDVAQKLANFPVTRPIKHGYVFDYGFVSDPVFTSKYMQTNHKEQNGKFPFAPQQLPDINEHNKMIYFIISDYSLNTWLYTAHRDNKLTLKVTPEKFKKEKKRKMFQTTCPGSICVGTFFPKISKAYPNSTIEMNFFTSKHPSVHFEPNHIQLKVPAAVEFIALRPGEESVNFLTADLVLFSELLTTVADDNILFTVTNTTTVSCYYPEETEKALTLENLSEATGTFDMDAVKTVLAAVVKIVETILPGQQFPLVMPSHALLSNPKIRIVKNAIIVESDLNIKSI